MVVSFLIALAIGIIVYALTDYGILIILWITLLIFGAALLVMSFMSSKESGKFGPSDFSYRMVMGAFITAIGLIGLLSTFTSLSWWILLAIFIIVVAVVVLAVTLTNGKKEGQ
jgi:hypothetical protein